MGSIKISKEVSLTLDAIRLLEASKIPKTHLFMIISDKYRDDVRFRLKAEECVKSEKLERVENYVSYVLPDDFKLLLTILKRKYGVPERKVAECLIKTYYMYLKEKKEMIEKLA